MNKPKTTFLSSPIANTLIFVLGLIGIATWSLLLLSDSKIRDAAKNHGSSSGSFVVHGYSFWSIHSSTTSRHHPRLLHIPTTKGHFVKYYHQQQHLRRRDGKLSGLSLSAIEKQSIELPASYPTESESFVVKNRRSSSSVVSSSSSSSSPLSSGSCHEEHHVPHELIATQHIDGGSSSSTTTTKKKKKKRQQRSWDERFQELVEFGKQHGHVRPKTIRSPEEKSLSQWVALQIKKYHRSSLASSNTNHHHQNETISSSSLLSMEQIERLESLEGWTWWCNRRHYHPEDMDHDDHAAFEFYYPKLVKFHQAHGHIYVPKTWARYRDLGQWVERQRHRWRATMSTIEEQEPDTSNEGHHSQVPFSQKQVDLLTAIGFHSNPMTSRIPWNIRYEELRQFFHKHGHSNVPKDYHNRQLHTWMVLQRRRMRVKVEAEEKGCSDPSASPTSLKPILPDQIELLERLNFTWNPVVARDKLRCDELVQFQKQYGHTRPNVTSMHEDHRRLGRWVRQQLDRYHVHHNNTNADGGSISPILPKAKLQKLLSSPLTPTMIQNLEAIDGWTWQTQASSFEGSSFDSNFQKLTEYHSRFGHTNVPSEWVEDKQLSRWVKKQRRLWKLMKTNERRQEPGESPADAPLSDEQIASLHSVDFDFEPSLPWMVRYQGLCRFFEKYGHSDVPMGWAEDPQLANWVQTQRQRFKRRPNQLKSERDGQRISSKKHGVAHTKQSDASTVQDHFALLEKVNFTWSVRRQQDDLWWKRYDELVSYWHSHPDHPFPRVSTKNGRKASDADNDLARWCANLRRLMKDYVLTVELEGHLDVHVSGLNEERITALKKLPFCWFPAEGDLVAPSDIFALDSRQSYVNSRGK